MSCHPMLHQFERVLESLATFCTLERVRNFSRIITRFRTLVRFSIHGFVNAHVPPHQSVITERFATLIAVQRWPRIIASNLASSLRTSGGDQIRIGILHHSVLRISVPSKHPVIATVFPAMLTLEIRYFLAWNGDLIIIWTWSTHLGYERRYIYAGHFYFRKLSSRHDIWTFGSHHSSISLPYFLSWTIRTFLRYSVLAMNFE